MNRKAEKYLLARYARIFSKVAIFTGFSHTVHSSMGKEKLLGCNPDNPSLSLKLDNNGPLALPRFRTT